MDADGSAPGFSALVLSAPAFVRDRSHVVSALVQPLPRENLERPQLILIEVERVLLGDIDPRVGIPLPPAAEIDRLIDPGDLVLAGDGQHRRVILAIADVRELDAPQHRRIERTRRPYGRAPSPF